MAQIVGCLAGMSEACIALDMPIVSGNVSLYNESKATGGGSAILPTPAIGAIGLLADWRKSATIGFKAEDQDIFLIGGGAGTQLGQTVWLREVHGSEAGSPPPVDLSQEIAAGELVQDLIGKGLVTASHDVSDGGVLVAVAEMSLASDFGAELEVPDWGTSPSRWFGENQGRYIVTADSEQDVGLLESYLADRGVHYEYIGSVRRHPSIWLADDPNAGEFWSIPLATLRAAHEGFFPALMDG